MLAPVAMWSRSAEAQTVTALPAALGEVVSATSGVTTFTFNPASGAVTKTSGSGTRVATTTARIAVSFKCSVAYCSGKSGATVVLVSPIGTPTGRAGALTNFTFNAGTATVSSGPTGSNPLTVTLASMAANSTVVFYIGADYPIGGDDSSGSTGTATSGVEITTENTKGGNVVNTATSATATVYRSMTLSQGSTLNFGRIVRPNSGTAIINLNASTGAVTATPAIALSTPSPTRATYTITAEGGSSVTINVSPTTFTLSGPSSSSIPVTLNSTSSGSVAMGGVLGSGVTYSFGVGGSMTISSATPSGGYTGTFGVTVNYN